MKLNKMSFGVSLICFLFSSIVVSQSEHYDDIINTFKKPINLRQTEKFELNEITNITSTTEGSPFNNNTNSQIDSVVLIKGVSGGEETIKYFYTYDSCGNVATEIEENHWQKKYHTIVSEI
ncbi:MAG: hypothetical protein L3J41_06435 [Melioribacteraceae bacterium]|nr:hypothetical protein [Melioribacteraceae bacterium]